MIFKMIPSLSSLVISPHSTRSLLSSYFFSPSTFPLNKFFSTSDGYKSTFLEQTLELSKQPTIKKIKKSHPIQKHRTGVIGTKIGMGSVSDNLGIVHPITIVHVDCQVIQTTPYNDNFVNIQLGAHSEKVKNASLAMLGHFAKAGTQPYKTLKEFRTYKENVLNVGDKLGADHFEPGHYVNVTGTTLGKGFQGAMKRHGFGGGFATHGNSKSHRALGSTGASQDPGRVWKGKKMAGRMGGKTAVTRKLLVYRVDKKNNLLWIRGSIPGHKGNAVFIKDYKPSQRLSKDAPDSDVTQVVFHQELEDFLDRKKAFLDVILPEELPPAKKRIRL